MTRQELTERLRRSRGMSDYENQTGDREAVAALDALCAEIDVLRRLPVISLCEDCAYQRHARCDHVESPNPSPVFTAKMAKSPPPEWCPLRGAR